MGGVERHMRKLPASLSADTAVGLGLKLVAATFTRTRSNVGDSDTAAASRVTTRRQIKPEASEEQSQRLQQAPQRKQSNVNGESGGRRRLSDVVQSLKRRCSC